MPAMKHVNALIILVAGLILISAGCGSDTESSATNDAGQHQNADAESPDAESPDAESPDAESPDAADTSSEGDAALAPPWDPSDSLGGDRPAKVVLPDDYDTSRSWPLVILLHGYTATNTIQDAYFGLSRRSTERGFITVLPNGTRDSGGNRFWNATDACCDFGNSGVDDVQYLTDLVGEAKERLAVDESRVYFMGHSNGGFMSYRMACELGSEIAAIASLAGAAFADGQDCTEDGQVGVLQIHGDADATVFYEGGEFFGNPYPGAPDVAERWATRNNCGQPQSGEPLDLDKGIAGSETDVELWHECDGERRVELWTIRNGGHIPSLSDDFTDHVLDFLFVHEL